MTAHQTEHSSLQILRDRLSILPDLVAHAAGAALPGTPVQQERFVAMPHIVVTGGGLSEGPARVLVALLRRAGRDARFEPQSAFMTPRAPMPDTALVLFSQGLAPNARLPLASLREAFGSGLLVTSVSPGADGIAAHAQTLVDHDRIVWTLPPEVEDKLLLRVLGPSVALVAALRIADLVVGSRHAQVADLALHVQRRLQAPAPDLFAGHRRPIAIVAEPELLDLAMPLRWKLLEGLRVPDPPVWDVLQVAHGPLQSLYEHPHTILTLRTSTSSSQDDLFARLRGVLRDHHAFIELRATVAGPAALVDLDAALDAALVSTLEAHPMSLDDWPSRGLDGPLYDVSPAP